LMVPLDRIKGIAPGEGSNTVMEILNEEDVGLVPVLDGEEVIGVIVRENLPRLARLRSRLSAK